MSKLCSNCGKEIADDALFCNSCGAKVSESTNTTDNQEPSQKQSSGQSQWGNFNYQSGQNQTSEVFSVEDIQANKVVSGLAYFIFFLPLVVCPDSRFGRFHANQALVLLIVGVVGSIITGIIPLLNFVIYPLFSIAVVIWGVMGLINGLNGQAKELPLIGKWRIIK